ncbi:hypothetical protein BJ170DRAFT_323158 [Xylariales sp. AK1849]|nr:hypothetical protein BJ170DRAFT_323158 [Xylariales sp. AK1849]
MTPAVLQWLWLLLRLMIVANAQFTMTTDILTPTRMSTPSTSNEYAKRSVFRPGHPGCANDLCDKCAETFTMECVQSTIHKDKPPHCHCQWDGGCTGKEPNHGKKPLCTLESDSRSPPG